MMRIRKYLQSLFPAATAPEFVCGLIVSGLVAIGLMIAVVAPCRAQAPASNVPIPPDRAQNSYAIYSVLIPGEFLTRLNVSQNGRSAISAITLNAQDVTPPLSPLAALRPPEKRASDFLEAVADYDQRKDARFLLTRAFQLDRPYGLLTPAEVDEFRASRSGPNASSSLRQKYRDYSGLTSVSQVYFNKTQTAALVYKLDWCGSLCAQAEWIYLEKKDGHWVRRSGKAKS